MADAISLTHRGLKINIHLLGSDKTGWIARALIFLESGERIALEPSGFLPDRALAQDAATRAACEYIDRLNPAI